MNYQNEYDSGEMYRWQRSTQKRELFKRFKYRVIERLYKKKFFELFGNCCFKCGIQEKPFSEIGKPPILCIDHHIPMALGGQLVPGNLVSLCRKCNNLKLDQSPEDFYSTEELEKLQPILQKQADIFNFTFDYDFWIEDQEGYLISLGLDQDLVHEILNNPEHPDHISRPMVITITADLSEIL